VSTRSTPFETSQLGFLLKRPIPAGQLEFTLDIRDAEALVNNMQGGNDKFSTLDPAVPVNGIAVTINGGDGDDEVIGTDGADVLNGGNGNDRLIGFKGPDTMNGQDGDDTMV
jgi:Ca2+-binding RTX toxin-like protein